MDFDEEMLEQAAKAEAIMKTKEPKVGKKGKVWDSATHEMQKPRKGSSGSDKSKEEDKK